MNFIIFYSKVVFKTFDMYFVPLLCGTMALCALGWAYCVFTTKECRTGKFAWDMFSMPFVLTVVGLLVVAFIPFPFLLSDWLSGRVNFPQ